MAETFLWIAIVSSVIALFAYEIWNLIVVAKDFSRLSKEARDQQQQQQQQPQATEQQNMVPYQKALAWIRNWRF